MTQKQLAGKIRGEIELVNRLQPMGSYELSNRAVACGFSELPDEQVDLTYIRSLFVSTGKNDNDDYFLPEELWKARSTPVFKPINWEHQNGRELDVLIGEKKAIDGNHVVGVISSAYPVNSQMEQVVAMPQDDEFHIMSQGVIWSKNYPKIAEAVERGARSKTLFVSMEVWFERYDYALGNDIIERNPDTKFLDKHLRRFGGTGEYEGRTVARVLRGLTFSGMGLVRVPANKPSEIKNVSVNKNFSSSSNELENKEIEDSQAERNNMAELNGISKEEFAAASKAFQRAEERADGLAKQNAELEAAVASKQAEVDKAEASLTQVQTKLAALASADESLSNVAELSIDGVVATVTETIEHYRSQASEAADELAKVKAELEKQALAQREASRASRIQAVVDGYELDEDSAKAMLSKLSLVSAGMTDESFDTYMEASEQAVAMYKKKGMKDKAMDKEEMKDEDKKDKGMSKPKAGKTKASDEDEKAEEEISAIASVFGLSRKEAIALIQAQAEEQSESDSEILSSLTGHESASAGLEPTDTNKNTLAEAAASLAASLTKNK